MATRIGATTPAVMNVERCRHGLWSTAYRCRVGACELIVVADVGPRILSLRQHGGRNLLYEDATGFHVGDWRLYGGHRFTVAPEGDQSYAPDNVACRVEASGDELSLAAPIGANGLQRTLIVGPSADAEGFAIGHLLENRGHATWRGALWAITCVPPTGRIIGACRDERIRFWPEAQQKPWRVVAGHVLITPDGSRSKGGWYSNPAWVASAQPEATLLIDAPNAPPLDACVDEGCNVEVFTCADYAELETLGGELTLRPGEHAVHRQHWRIVAPSVDWRSLRRFMTSTDAPPSAIHAA